MDAVIIKMFGSHWSMPKKCEATFSWDRAIECSRSVETGEKLVGYYLLNDNS